MTYANLTANLDILRSGNEDVLNPQAYSDAALLDLYKVAAKLEMKLDIEQSLGIAYDDDGSTLDDATDKNAVRLARALAFKQLCLFYQKNDAGAETKNRIRWELYRSLYERERLGFGGLSKNAPTSSVSSQTFKR